MIAADSRGHGGSEPVTGRYTIRDMAEDWLALLDALGAKQWCLVGFSQGGMIAQWIAALEPARTRARGWRASRRPGTFRSSRRRRPWTG